MNHKWLIPAEIFLAIALIVPPYLLVTQNDADIDNLLSKAPDTAAATQKQGILQDINDNDFTVYIIAFIVEIVAVFLFVVTLWLAIKP